jgi:hypothetical protein
MKYTTSYIVFILVAFSVFRAFGPHLHDYPKGVHAWAQADRLSLGMMYQSERNFLNPRTHSLMSDDGKVGVEFPILPYLSSSISAWTGYPIQAVFRILGLCILFLSMLIVWRIGRDHVFDSFRFMLLILILYSSPIVLFYSGSFLPDPSALALGSIGLALFIFGKEKTWPELIGLSLLTLAAAIKTSFGIYLIALTASLFLFTISKKRTKNRSILFFVALAFIALIAYYDFSHVIEKNKRLWAVIFLSESQPIQTWQDFSILIKQLIFWSDEYLSWPQKLFLFLNLGLLFFGLKNRAKRNTFSFTFMGIAFLGFLGFLVVFGKQFFNHDYYFLAAVHPLFIMLGFIFAKTWCSAPTSLVSGRGILLLILVPICIFIGTSKTDARMEETFSVRGREITNKTEWLRNGEAKLEELGVLSEDPIFVLYEYSPNLPLVHFNRRGKVFDHGEMRRETEHFEYWYDRIKPTCIIVRNSFVNELKEKPHVQRVISDQTELDTFTIFWTKAD